ncbi:Apoptosis regulator Bcl-2 [Struthio camelus australis]|uniref:Apoptosis regulator Bcl-2 n=1 Tax=Struthio camelus australis TaxID=441894 RepID=A0A093HJC5_STRCA|nr:Apoptosis regulator Bcl-2 [Struthio camelus australis]
MAHPGRRGYDNREIVLKYIHYKLSQRGYDWVASGDRAPASPGLSPPAAAALAAAGTSSDHTGLVSPHPEPPGSAAASNAAPGDGLRPAPPVGHLLRRQAGGENGQEGYEKNMLQRKHRAALTLPGSRATFWIKLCFEGEAFGTMVTLVKNTSVRGAESNSAQQLYPSSENIYQALPTHRNSTFASQLPNSGGLDAFVELYGNSMRPLFDFSWISLKTILSLVLVGACITLGAYLGHK